MYVDNMAIRCDFLDADNCLRVYYIIGSSAPIHAEQTGVCLIFELL